MAKRLLNRGIIDLYLIDPPPEAKHRPVKPEHIVVAGDSAGGGLTLALLQVLRDTGLPLPAGGVLISPWCDLTHSFPSIHTNTATDVIQSWGLSFQKPSTLWPPPPQEMTNHVQSKLRTRIRQKLHIDHFHRTADPKDISKDVTQDDSTADMPVNLGSISQLPTSTQEPPNHTLNLTTANGEKISINDQIHMYAPNNLLSHPLVSPVLSYLGGLPPLLFIASDKEVLRDEIIYAYVGFSISN
jgi:acetyl esterase/lipase